MRSGLLLAFPLESVALRLALALGVALVLLRAVSSLELRSPRARSTLAVSPFVVAAAVVLFSSRDLGLPSILVPSGAAAGSLAVPVADRYLDFVPVGPFVVALWAAVSLTLVALRIARARSFRRSVLEGAQPAEPRVAALVLRLARTLGITPPRVLVVQGRIGGAAVIGVRDPLLLVDTATLITLDPEELEGVIAHELAHVARRDNLVAWAVAVIRDVAFFVPGARWAVHALHREREAAADHDAAALTGRPAALASGLLRVVELGRDGRAMPHACAALVPSASVVDRVELLLSGSRPTVREHRTELSLAAAVSLVAVAVAVVLPSMLAGSEGQRDALGVLVGSGASAAGRAAEASTGAMADVEGRVFAVYRSVAPAGGENAPSVRPPDVRVQDIIGPEDRPGMAEACAVGAQGCRSHAVGHRLTLRPAPIVLLDHPVAGRWQATPVSEAVSGDRFAVYWLARMDMGRGVG
jgi:beta-lactamase regulating signal transducer with metallopeptidase domain